jgi:hypothetical protein
MSDSQPAEPSAKPIQPMERSSSRPPSRDSSAHLHAALSASGRAEASLSTLMRSIRDLSSGVSGAREANVQLLRELESMSDLLGAANERQLALKNRIGLLEQQLDRARVESQREREYILDQQDAFIAAMMEDHEQVIAELNREIETLRHRPSQRSNVLSLESAEAPAPDSGVHEELEAARKLIDKLVGDRERTRETLLKVQAQRDEAQAALVEVSRTQPTRSGEALRSTLPGAISPTLGRAAATLPPPEAAVRASAAPAGSPSSGPLPAVITGIPPAESARSVAPFGPRPKAPELELTPREVPDRLSQYPEELRAAVHPPSGDTFPQVSATASEHGGPDASSVIPVNTNTSSRPGGYSMTNSVAPEHVSGTPRISRVPRG